MYKLFCLVDKLAAYQLNKVQTDIRCQFTIGPMINIMKTIERAIRPLFLTCQILGLCVYTSKPYLSTLYNVTVWCAYCYLFYYIAIAQKEEWFLATSTLIYYGMNFLVSITSIIISLHQHKVCTYIHCLKKLWY